jgi:transposase-like protein/IS1 family transposase
MTCIRCQHSEARRFGFYGRNKIQRFRCPSCKATFSAPRQRPYGRHYISTESATQIVTPLLEGISLRAISHITGVHKNTIGSLLLTVGRKSRTLFDAKVRNIHPRLVQAHELWTFVHTKEPHLFPGNSSEWGDQYAWMAIDSETKFVLSYLTGKREAGSAHEFILDLSTCTVGRSQITTDGLKGYIPAIEEHLGADVDFAQLVKFDGAAGGEGPEWQAPSQVTATIPTPIIGTPHPTRITTSHVEPNQSLRVTPAMQAELADHA